MFLKIQAFKILWLHSDEGLLDLVEVFVAHKRRHEPGQKLKTCTTNQMAAILDLSANLRQAIHLRIAEYQLL